MSTTKRIEREAVEEEGPPDRRSELELARERLVDAQRQLWQVDHQIDQALRGFRSGDGGRADSFYWFPALIGLEGVETLIRLIRKEVGSRRFVDA